MAISATFDGSTRPGVIVLEGATGGPVRLRAKSDAEAKRAYRLILEALDEAVTLRVRASRTASLLQAAVRALE